MRVQCNYCGLVQNTKGRKDFKCKWCNHRIRRKANDNKTQSNIKELEDGTNKKTGD